jgi:diacylglycerol kinase (ATP)
VKEQFLAIVNPAAGGGKLRKRLRPTLERLRQAGIAIDVAETNAPGQATQLVRQAYAENYGKFISVGGDGTSYEIVNGLFPEASAGERVTMGFLPLGTGNSFLRDFSEQGLEFAAKALRERRSQACDVLKLTHTRGVVYYINLLSMGFSADVASMRSRWFRGWGELGYQLAIFFCLLRFRRRPFPLEVDGEPTSDRRPCLFLSFNNSKYTGGTMMIAPQAEINDGLIEYVRWGAIGRLGLIRNLPTLYDGTHIRHPLAERRAAKNIRFELGGPVDIMVDGEVLNVHCQSLDVLPSALNVVV